MRSTIRQRSSNFLRTESSGTSRVERIIRNARDISSQVFYETTLSRVTSTLEGKFMKEMTPSGMWPAR
ncbi:MAG: hypothetical protein ACYCR5_06235 [Leptospirillum sp.]